MLKITYSIILFTFCTTILAQKESPTRLSDSINTPADEYWARITADDSTLIFNRLVGTDDSLKQEDFFFSTKNKKGQWRKAIPLKDLNTYQNEGVQTMSANGRFMVFSACNRDDGYGSCDLYYCIKVGNKWLPPRNMGGEINTISWETQPSLSSTGRELFFVSNRKGGQGKMDIWQSSLINIDKNGVMHWSKPINLSINTSSNDMSPFLHNDNNTLYFSSKGYKGEGGLDIFITKRNGDLFSTPKNIGSPPNTKNDEIGFIVDNKGETAFFTSKYKDNKDIFSLKIPPNIRPSPVHYIKGKVLKKDTKEPILANIRVQNIRDKQEKNSTLTDPITGEYLICLTGGKQWQMIVQKKGFLFYSKHIDLISQKTIKNPQNIILAPIKKGEKIYLNNILFDVDKSELKPESEIELLEVKKLLFNNPKLYIELEGHTDTQGSKQYNQKLSERRAFAVYKWLISQGVNRKRLKYKGYGDTMPIKTNKTKEGRLQNRRTELKIIRF